MVPIVAVDASKALQVIDFPVLVISRYGAFNSSELATNLTYMRLSEMDHVQPASM